MSDEQLEIEKRHTLNWLIQGASQHAGMTLHHLVRDELNALDARLLSGYDQFALLLLLQYWRGVSVLMVGWPPRFWKRAASDPHHPFFHHPLLAKYGGMLAEAAKQRALERCTTKRVSALPFLFSFKVVSLLTRLRTLESPHRLKLLQLATKTASTVWGIPEERLEAELSAQRVLPADHFAGENFQAQVLRSCVIGYGSVARRRDELIVTAKGVTWQLLTKELVKGTAELICLHGLRELDDGMYQHVIKAADRIDFEPWMLQSGGELWRRLLLALPNDCPVAEVLMNLARLPPTSLHSVLAKVIEQAVESRDLLASLAESSR
jgi:hypothetical protein